MTATTVLYLLLVLSFKHLVVDFFLQGPYQWMNKGTYMHPGGLLHAGLHGLGTAMVLAGFASHLPHSGIVFVISGLSLIDAFVHYHVDWAKVNINKHFGWKADTHPEFWNLLGVDQFLHMITYIGIILMVA